MNAIPIAADERMPDRKIATFSNDFIGTGARQPVHAPDFFGVEHLAIFDEVDALRIVAATTALTIKQATGDVGKRYLAAIFIFDFMEAALATIVAKAFPFIGTHLFKSFCFPKR